ncbi:uncharacterized protein LOC113797524 [Dermatophagoides pteronyssinus]|uniref:uncharacterized protein LOC113797524 n=1 Tax=Dermatophagoides pteronyssinus TaxID=6956 RepID=UPI003F66D066
MNYNHFIILILMQLINFFDCLMVDNDHHRYFFINDEDNDVRSINDNQQPLLPPPPPLKTIFDLVNESQSNADSNNKLILDGFFQPNFNSNHNDNVDDDNDADDPNETTSTTSTKINQKQLKINDLKICVTLTPGYVSTRKKLVNYECQARICRMSSNDFESIIDDQNDDYHFEKPIFDWKTDLNHLLVTNSSCDSTRKQCKFNLDINVENFSREMESNGMKIMKITCNVADFIRINNNNNNDNDDDEIIERNNNNSPGNLRYHYISGQADAFVKIFKGNRIHQACNRTDDCGENMVCNPSNQSKDSSSSNYNNNGYCECPNESIRIQIGQQQSSSNKEDKISLNTFILVIDHHYDELICAEKRHLNQSCQYDQQCQSIDQNSNCRPIYSSNGFATPESICDCSFGYVDDRQSGKCINVYSVTKQSNDDGENRLPNYRLSNYPTVVPKGVYIWWIIQPKHSNITTTTTTANRIISTYQFLWQRYSHQRYLTQCLLAIMLFVPFFILLISSAYLHYYRRQLMAVDKRKYKPPILLNSMMPISDRSPPSPPISTLPPPTINEQKHNNHKQQQQEKPNTLSKQINDKSELIKNDQLNHQFYQIQFQ